jgi:hypothetical protein
MYCQREVWYALRAQAAPSNIVRHQFGGIMRIRLFSGSAFLKLLAEAMTARSQELRRKTPKAAAPIQARFV